MLEKDVVISCDSITKSINNLTYSDYYYRLMLLARSVFKWNNLPNGIDEKWIEKYLYLNGSCIFFKDKEKGFMVTKATDAGVLNYYDEPTLLRPDATNYIFQGEALVNGEECVLIRNNDIMIPTAPTIELYAARLTEITRTIDINIEAQQTPLLVLCSDKQKMTLKNVYKQWSGHEPVIFGSKDLDVEGIKTINTGAPIVFDKLEIQKHDIWNEAMTFLGINNANTDKRERLVDDEVQANNEQIEQSCAVMLKARQRACEQINNLFGLNVSVEVRIQNMPVVEPSESITEVNEEEVV